MEIPNMVVWLEPKPDQVRTHFVLRQPFSVTADATRAPNFYGSAGDGKRIFHKLLGLFFPFSSKLELTDSASVHPLTILHPLIGTKKDIHNAFSLTFN
jgi:hypothetical protein